MISLPAVCVHDTIFVDVTHKYEMPGWSIAVMVVLGVVAVVAIALAVFSTYKFIQQRKQATGTYQNMPNTNA